jgi:hypothetical protein
MLLRSDKDRVLFHQINNRRVRIGHTSQRDSGDEFTIAWVEFSKRFVNYLNMLSESHRLFAVDHLKARQRNEHK